MWEENSEHIVDLMDEIAFLQCFTFFRAVHGLLAVVGEGRDTNGTFRVVSRVQGETLSSSKIQNIALDCVYKVM